MHLGSYCEDLFFQLVAWKQSDTMLSKAKESWYVLMPPDVAHFCFVLLYMECDQLWEFLLLRDASLRWLDFWDDCGIPTLQTHKRPLGTKFVFGFGSCHCHKIGRNAKSAFFENVNQCTQPEPWIECEHLAQNREEPKNDEASNDDDALIPHNAFFLLCLIDT